MDRQLVERAIQGDEDAYAGLMAIAGDRLLAIAYRILRDLHRAEDAVQVALVNAWRDLPTLRDADRFEAWLTRILVPTRRRRSPIGIASIAASGDCRPTSGRSSSSITTWDGASRRLPERSNFPSGR